MSSHRSFYPALLLAAGCLCFGAPALAEQGSATTEESARSQAEARVSPARRIERRGGPRSSQGPESGRPTTTDRYPSIDGTGHHRGDAETGAAHTPLVRLVPSDYADDLSSLAGPERPGAREISNGVIAQTEDRPNTLGISDYLWQWGQFVDHDIDLTDGVDPPEPANIAIPAGDSYFDPTGTGTAELAFNRSLYDPDSGVDSPRQQINEITSWIDASNVYGSDEERAAALRLLDGSGKLRTSDGNLLPFNVDGLSNAGGSGAELFLAGDVRANEQVGLTAMHTLFMREHNRLADEIASAQPGISGEEIYQRARLLVIAEMQVITYREFLPALLGPNALPPYRGYDDSVNAGISNLFSSASYRFGHSTLSPTILRLDAQGEETADGHLALRDAFFSPNKVIEEGGIEPLLRGLSKQVCQAADAYVIDDLRNFLFGPPGSGGFDLTSLNLQRGRDHGLPSYADAREELGLARPIFFSDISSDPDVQARLEAVYGEVDSVDVWLGGLAEDPMPGAMVGELIAEVVRDQFVALRDGDRFWYENRLGPEARDRVERTRLADVIRRNTSIGREISDDVFRVSKTAEGPDVDGPRGDGRRGGGSGGRR